MKSGPDVIGCGVNRRPFAKSPTGWGERFGYFAGYQFVPARRRHLHEQPSRVAVPRRKQHTIDAHAGKPIIVDQVTRG